MDLKKTYDALVAEARIQKIPCTLTLTNHDITAQLGMDYSDRLCDKIAEASYKVGMGINELSICAEMFGPGVLESTRIAGGPVNYRSRRRY